jgi:hypothetical protein
MPGDQISQWRGLEQPRAEQARQPVGLQQVRHLAVGEHAPQHVVVSRAHECERGDQRAGAGSGDDRKLRPGPARGPSGQKTGPERAIGAAAGQRQRSRLLQRDGGSDGPFRRDARIISPYTGVGNTGNDSCRLLLRGIGDARHGCAAHKDHGANGDGERTDYASHLPCNIGHNDHVADVDPPFHLHTRAILAWF